MHASLRAAYAAAAALTAMLQLHGCNPPAFLLRRRWATTSYDRQQFDFICNLYL